MSEQTDREFIDPDVFPSPIWKWLLDLATLRLDLADRDAALTKASDEIAEFEARIAAARKILDGAPYSPAITEALAALEGAK